MEEKKSCCEISQQDYCEKINDTYAESSKYCNIFNRGFSDYDECP